MRSLLILLNVAVLACAQATPPLRLEKTIELPDVQGRIDHMSLDIKGGRLFVAALGNNTIEVVDLKSGKRVNTITGLKEPQGVLYVPAADRVFVANGGDGSVRIFDGTSLKLLKTVEYGDDADNLRYDSNKQHIYVGYGSGALGEFDTDGQKIADAKLDAHPESFQLEKNGPRIYVNLPKSLKVAVVDREKHAVIAKWRTGAALANYPMALDEAGHRLFVVTRYPAHLMVFDSDSGKVIQILSVAGDCDDVFYDQARKRIYASGGEGTISVFEQQSADQYKEIARMATVKGARTSLFSPELGRLFLAVRNEGTQAAKIQVFEAPR
ncbi:MAG: YncE family protein [Acidobacteriales bacterium]|nr:YncE family protein [Terriglobales bacterium]